MKIVKARTELAAAIAAEVAAVIKSSITSKGSCRIVLTGGGLGLEVLSSLRLAAIDWQKVTVIFSDERFVGLSDKDRNEFKALERLPELEQANFLRYPDTKTDLDTAAELFNSKVEAVFVGLTSENTTFDLVILGMGPDGHVASLFPGKSYPSQWIVAEADSPKPPSERLSLSYEALGKAERVWFVASGKEKALAAKSAMISSDLPAGRVKGRSETVWWIDQELSDEL